MKKTDTWMALYIGDYLADTSHLTTEQHGAYLLLLMALWKRGSDGLPDTDENLAAAARLSTSRWKAIRTVLIDGSLLRTDGSIVTQKRLNAELSKAGRITEARANAGAKGGAKAAANRQRTGVAKEQQNSTPSPSQELKHPSDAPAQDPPASDLPATPLRVVPPAPPPPFDGNNAKAIPAKAQAPLAKAFELPEDWGLDAEALGFPRPRILTESERFRQWWTVGKGAGKRKSLRGWRQAWSNWLGKAAERAA